MSESQPPSPEQPVESHSRFRRIMSAAGKPLSDDLEDTQPIKVASPSAPPAPSQELSESSAPPPPQIESETDSQENLPVEQPYQVGPESVDLQPIASPPPLQPSLDQSSMEVPPDAAQFTGPFPDDLPTIPPVTPPPQLAGTQPVSRADSPTFHPLPAPNLTGLQHRREVKPPAIDRTGMPLPHRVSELDPYATRVTPSAYTAAPQPVARRGTGGKAGSRQVPPPPSAVSGWQRAGGCLLRLAILGVFLVVLAALIVGSVGVYQYYRIAATLPNIEDLQKHASQFETTRILDRNGNVLYEILDPNAGRRTYVPLDKISPYLIAATLATEDKGFYAHPGFDPLAILRALIQNYTSGDIASGASTITQQLARGLLFSPEERNQRTYERKAREIVLAAELTRRYTKEQILELYLNENYYSNLAYGIEAAAETYFGTTSDKLDLAQSAFLAGLPQAPGVYDVFSNRQGTMDRFKSVLVLMYQDSQEQNCIEVSTNRQPVCVDASAVASAAQQIEEYQFKKPTFDIRYPHWVQYVRSLLEAQYDPQTIYRSGFTVYTSLDPALQDQAEKIVRTQVDSLADKHVTDGALVAIRPRSGEILAMVGSADFYNDAIAGQVNMAVSPRQPGSSIKPLTYAAAFEKGWTPSTIIWDVPTSFPPSGDPNDPRPRYEPPNYDGKFHGPVTVRTALANSYNIPAVKALNFIGVYGSPEHPDQGGLINFANRLGITSLTRNDYGLALTLGGGEVSLLEMTGAFAVFANEGQRIPPVAITKIVDHSGNVVFEYHPPAGEQVMRAEHAYLISSILSDNQARAPMFGTNSVLNLPFPAAAKTGTTNDFRDNWTMGYTPDLAVGVWVGNADYTPMVHTTGVTGAAPIWSDFMQYAVPAITGGNPSSFARPAGIVEKVVCAASGTEPSEWCPEQRTEIFAADQLPLPKTEDLWKKVTVDTWTGLTASPACADSIEEKMVLNITDTTGIKWVKDSPEGKAWAENLGFKEPFYFTPERACKADDPRPLLSFSGLSDGQTITTSPLDIYGVADAPLDFEHFRLQWGEGDNPTDWKPLVERSTTPVKQVDKIYSWDLKDVPPGRITLRLYIESVNDTNAEKKIHLNIQVPTPTPTPTLTPTATSTNTPLPTYTPTVPTNTPVPPTPTPTNTPVPPTPTASLTNTIVPASETFTSTFTPTFTLAVSESLTPTPTSTPSPSGVINL